jgi:hypothetical protein
MKDVSSRNGATAQRRNGATAQRKPVGNAAALCGVAPLREKSFFDY